MARKGMIRFRCWYCNRQLSAGGDCFGERRVCNCGQRVRVPRYSGGPSRDKSLLDWVIEFVVYGGGCALLGLGLGLLIVSKLSVRGTGFRSGLVVVGGLTTIGLLVGGLFGERGVNWIGSLIRHYEEKD